MKNEKIMIMPGVRNQTLKDLTDWLYAKVIPGASLISVKCEQKIKYEF